ncbi:uncharacterized protein [Apostichopus japonicus]|uniref:uncharacterized protein n=1 Tax=Stichopus japonicus TaxID=307972 RepID=UPI003AB8904E
MAEAPDPSIVSCESASGIDNDENSNLDSKAVSEVVTASMCEIQNNTICRRNCDRGMYNIDGSGNQLISNSTINIHVSQQLRSAPDTNRHSRTGGQLSGVESETETETESKIFRVVPFSKEMKDKTNDRMVLTVWFCQDHEYKDVLEDEHENENITLDSHDTLRLEEHSPGKGIQKHHVVTVTVTTNNSNAWIPDKDEQKLSASQIWQVKTKCSFRLKKKSTAGRNQLYITLTIHQEVNGERKKTEFILQKRTCDMHMTRLQKDTLVEQAELALPANHTNYYRTVSVVPFVNKVFHVDEDLILTVWMCPMDDNNLILKALKEEQNIHSKKKLDTENSFIICNWEQPVMANIELCDNNWKIRNLESKKELETLKLKRGQTKCQFALNKIDHTLNIGVKISLWQAEETNKIEFPEEIEVDKLQVVDNQQHSGEIQDPATLRRDSPQCSQPRVEKELNEEGGVLELKKHGVRLEVPCGALRKKCKIQMTVILPSEIQMDHSLDSNSSMVIELLPSNLQLLKPAALTYPHCLVLKKGSERKATIQSSDHAAGCQQVWMDIDAQYQVIENKITIMLTSFSWKRFIVGDEIVVGKNIQWFAAKKLSFTDTNTHLEIGYFWDLPGLEEDLMSERNHAVLLHRMPAVFYKEGRHPLVAEINKDKSTSWIYHGQNRKEIPFEHVATNQWGFCSFELERKDSNVTGDITSFFKVGQDQQLVDFIVPMKMSSISRSEDPSHLAKTDRVSEGTWHDEEKTAVTEFQKVKVEGVSRKFGDVFYKLRDATFRLRHASYQLREAFNPTTKASYPLRKASYPIREAAYPLRKASYPIREASYPLRKASYPIREASYPLRKASYPLREASYPLEDVSCKLEVVSSKLRDVPSARSTFFFEDVSSKLEDVSSKVEDVSSKVVDVSSKFEDVSSKLRDFPSARSIVFFEDVSTILEDISSKLEAVSSKLEDVHFKIRDVPSERNIVFFEDVSSKLEDVSSKLRDASFQLEDVPFKLEDVPFKLEDVSSKVGDVSSILGDFSSKLGDVSSELRDASFRLEDFPSKLRDASLRIKDFSSKLRDATFRLRDTSRVFRDATFRLEAYSNAFRDASFRRRAHTNAFKDVSSKLEAVSSKLEDVSSKLEDVSSKLRDASFRLRVHSYAFEDISSKVRDVSSQLDDISSNLRDVSSQLQIASYPLRDVSYQLRGVRFVLEDVSSKLEDVSSKLEDVSSKLRDGSFKLKDDSSRGKYSIA